MPAEGQAKIRTDKPYLAGTLQNDGDFARGSFERPQIARLADAVSQHINKLPVSTAPYPGTSRDAGAKLPENMKF